MAIADLDAIMGSSMNEEELDELWSHELMGAYEPTNDGRTYREWFTELRRFFAE